MKKLLLMLCLSSPLYPAMKISPPLWKIVIGLGNKGWPTKHNWGRLALTYYIGARGIQVTEDNDLEVGLLTFDDKSIMVARPSIMNASGEFLKELECEPESVLVIHDDLELPNGEIRLDQKNSSHRGVRSVAKSLGSSAFRKIRIGIGRPRSRSPEAICNWICGGPEFPASAENTTPILEITTRMVDKFICE
jgi:PTH1 family peptidyl-tRNA hydrolase